MPENHAMELVKNMYVTQVHKNDGITCLHIYQKLDGHACYDVDTDGWVFKGQCTMNTY